jgi:hypothetical protein
MRTFLLTGVIAASLLLPRPAAAQVSISLQLDLPVVLPALVVVEPGIQVVPQVNEEIFFVDGYYWVRRDSHWYRSHDHRRGWVVIENRGVPARLVQYPPGHYRRYDPKQEKRGHDGDRHEGGKHDEGNHGDNGKDKGHGKGD